MESNDLNKIIKDIKHLFMAYRNGIVSDTLRKAGQPFNIIFGLQLPQIAEIAKNYGYSDTIADALWQDKGIRESRLLACYLFTPDNIDIEKAFELGSEVRTVEEADILCFRLLRRLPFAETLALRLTTAESPLAAYCGEALRRNLDSLA
jgi:hypothetical protein